MNKLLILGIGNEILTDDGIGIKITNNLSNRLNNFQFDFKTLCTGGLEILEIICNYKRVVIIDAIKTKDGVPGSVYLLKPDNFKETSHISSFHDISFLEAIKLGGILDLNIPEDFHIIAVEIIEDLEFNEKLSPELEKNYNQILIEVENIILNLLK